MSTKKKKSWRDKLADSTDLPKVSPIEENMSQRWGEGTFVIPAPVEVDEIMRRVRPGKLITIDDIRAKLAKKHGATISCPLTTGIFAWIAAHAADEAELEGHSRITSYWRTLKSGGELNPKYPGGIENLKARLEAEGHTIVQKRKRHFGRRKGVRNEWHCRMQCKDLRYTGFYRPECNFLKVVIKCS